MTPSNLDYLCRPRTTTAYKLAGAETFRASSGILLKKFGDYGGNLQNVSKSLRRFYHADKGMLLCQIDQAGAEAKIVAYLCRKGNYRALFDNGIKPHIYMAMKAFQPEWEQITGNSIAYFVNAPISNLRVSPGWQELSDLIKSSDDWPGSRRYYFIGKKIIHASSYGMKAPTFALNVLSESEGTIRMSVKEAAKHLAIFHATCPEIGQWHRETEELFRKQGYLCNLFGYPWHKKGTVTDELLRKLFAFCPQSTVGCITHIAITNMQNYIESEHKHWDILNNDHDSVLLQAPENEILEAAKVGSKFMNQDLISPRGEPFQMSSGIAVGKNWAPYKEGYNPDGLKEIKL